MGGCGARGLIWLLGLLTCAVLGGVRALLEKPLARSRDVTPSLAPADSRWKLAAAAGPVPALCQLIQRASA
jgi:hypothetical protein